MSVRVALACAVVVVPVMGGALVGSAKAQELKPDEARHFVAGKLFSYTCFEGTTGTGRIHPDGSVVGSISVRGTSPVRFVALPAGTIRIKPDSICAAVRGVPMQPCFNVRKTSENSFRGSISGLGFAYCDFVRRNPRLRIAGEGEGPKVLPSALTAAAQ